MIEKYKTKVVKSKPIYVGCAMLDFSKLTMLEFHYNVIENILKINTLCLMETLIALFIILNILIFMNGYKRTVNILIYHIMYVKICVVMKIRKNYVVLKDELNGRVMTEML